jgi:hypothetical protein
VSLPALPCRHGCHLFPCRFPIQVPMRPGESFPGSPNRTALDGTSAAEVARHNRSSVKLDRFSGTERTVHRQPQMSSTAVRPIRSPGRRGLVSTAPVGRRRLRAVR